MNKLSWWLLIFVFVTLTVLPGCDRDDHFDEAEDIPEASDANKFIFESMGTYYLWVDKVPELNDTKYNNKDNLNQFLNNFDNPKDLFNRLKYEELDNWSELFESHNDIDNWLAGISESTGFIPVPYNIDGTNEVIALVIYVLKGSPAEKAGIKRGDYIIKIDGKYLTLDNYEELLYTGITRTYHMATVDENLVIHENGITHTVTSEINQENPIFMDSIYNIDGYKVGYLVYNGFTSAYDDKLGNSYDILLNEVFLNFKNAGVNKLILDLRYNLGGDVQTAGYLASMIYSTDSTKVFAKTIYNDLVNNELLKIYGDEYNTEYFKYYINEKDWELHDADGNYLRTVKTPKTPIASLNLQDIHVLTSVNTVSASELLIVGLEPYNIDVKCIGTPTRGKYVGSWTLKDWIDDDYNLNPNHSYGMQLIVAKMANSIGFSDYIDGLSPDIEVEENLWNILPFGDTQEPLLKAALDDIRGIQTKTSVIKDTRFKPLEISKSLSPLKNGMHLKPFKIVPFK
jgi:C-terminal processing protease CtpA/Prc